MHLGVLGRETGAPGRGRTTAGAWASKDTAYRTVGGPQTVEGTLYNTKYITPNHYLVKQMDALDKRRPRSRPKSQPLAPLGGSTKMVTLSAKELDPFYAQGQSSTLKAVMRSSSGYFASLSWAPLGDEATGHLKGVAPPALKVRHDQPTVFGGGGSQPSTSSGPSRPAPSSCACT